MSWSRVLLICTMALALVSPSAMLAQEARVTFPVAVVALEGSHEPSEDGQGCELVWQSSGTPTLRVSSSSGDRFRQDLVGGEVVTVPDVDDGASCLFRVDVSVVAGRSHEISIEGEELTLVSGDDLEGLSATMVLPVEAGPEGEFVLATDDFLDLELEETAVARSADRTVPGVLRKVETPVVVPDATPGATPDMPVATPQVSDPIAVDIQLLALEDMRLRMRSGCRIALPDDEAVLSAQATAGDARTEVSLTSRGKSVNAATSPTGEPGCLFETTMELDPAEGYVFQVGETELAVMSFADLASRDEPLLLVIARDGNRTPETEGAAGPEHESTPEPVAEGGPIGDGFFLVSGRLDFWSDEAEMSGVGCSGGPGNGDIAPGAQVIVRNEVGAIIGYGTLEDSTRSGAGRCSYDFAVEVPGAAFYVIELGERGSVVYSQEELENTDWRMILETGEK